MRIVYSYFDNVKPPVAVSPASAISDTRRESVMVVRLSRGKAEDGVKRFGLPAEEGSAAPRWKTSDEAVTRDQEVRGHENAHLSALGPYAASMISYSTAKGADGESLARGGQIAVDMAPVPGDPEATLRKARTILNAAGAPGDPSAADQRVAERAYSLMRQARSELQVDINA